MNDNNRNIKIIGLTGGIGSGKTTVAKTIEAKGYPVYYSDVRAKEIVNDDEVLKEKIITLLGERAYDEQGKYNRKWVAEQVFNDKDLLQKLNSLIHPAVKNDFEEWVARQTVRFVFKETALLFELGLDKNCYKSILVTADENIRIQRVMERDGRTYKQVKEIISKQMSEEEKIKKADFVLYNNGKLSELEKNINKVIAEINKE